MANELSNNIASVVYQYGVANEKGEYIFQIPNLGFLIVSLSDEVVGTQPKGSEIGLLMDGDSNVTPFHHLQALHQVAIVDFIADNCYQLGRIGLDSLEAEQELDWVVEPLVVAINEELTLGSVGVYLDRDDDGDVNVIGIFDFGGADVVLTAYKDTEEGIESAKSDIDLWVKALIELRDKL